jgi:dihydroflavonol-4-reductase
MARLATSELFYSSEKAQRELDYDYRPLRDLVGPAADWYRGCDGDPDEYTGGSERAQSEQRPDPTERPGEVSD